MSQFQQAQIQLSHSNKPQVIDAPNVDCIDIMCILTLILEKRTNTGSFDAHFSRRLHSGRAVGVYRSHNEICKRDSVESWMSITVKFHKA